MVTRLQLTSKLNKVNHFPKICVQVKASIQRAHDKTDCMVVHWFYSLCNTVFETMSCFYYFSPGQEVPLSIFQRGVKERELDQLKQNYTNDLSVIEMWDCKWWRLYKTDSCVEQDINVKFRHGQSFPVYQHLEDKNLKLGHFFYKIDHYIEYFLQKCFKNCVQSAVNTVRQSDENIKSSVVTEVLILLSMGSCSYQILDRS